MKKTNKKTTTHEYEYEGTNRDRVLKKETITEVMEEEIHAQPSQ